MNAEKMQKLLEVVNARLRESGCEYTVTRELNRFCLNSPRLKSSAFFGTKHLYTEQGLYDAVISAEKSAKERQMKIKPKDYQESNPFVFDPALHSRVVATVRRYTIKLNNLKEKAK